MATQPLPNAAAPPPDPLRRIFFGPSELRAGWRLLLFILAIVLIAFPVGWLTWRYVPRMGGAEMTPGLVIVNDLRRFLVVLLASWVMALLEKRSLGDYGLPARSMFGKDFWVGSLWGFLMLSAIMGLMGLTHSYSFGALALDAAAILKFGLLWALAFLSVGFAEEFAFRGYLQFTLTGGLGFWPAAALTCALFAWVHHGNPGETWVGLLNIVLIAVFICLALRRTGSLWFPIGWHMAFDWGESFFYSVPDSGTNVAGHLFKATIQGNKWLSGGSVGPEASVFNVVVTVIGIALFAWLYPQANYPRNAPARDIVVAASTHPSLP
jgi:CAAX protease family protein